MTPVVAVISQPAWIVAVRQDGATHAVAEPHAGAIPVLGQRVVVLQDGT